MFQKVKLIDYKDFRINVPRREHIYHRKVKQINSNHKRIKKTRIAHAFLENRSRDFWSEISKMRRKTHRTPSIVEGFSNDEDISSCFSNYYEELYNSVSFDSVG